MEKDAKTLMLRIFISSTDKMDSAVLYEHLVFKAKEDGIAGATVIKGVLGYGASSVLHSYKFWEASEKVPVIVELVDEEQKIRAFYEDIRLVLEEMRYGCLVTLEPVEVLLYKSGKNRMFNF